ncbi:type II secretory pathway protein ExeA [Tundrisphaera lichenicola]|uniref:type II secretory pathway protein ExeA n=1 Tax=Tundrisphaera lichenicola TaxID=2029860 RepID=UPI003EBFABC9
MWHRHWSLTFNPFDERRPTFVPAPSHAEARARLIHTIESASRSARLIAGPGLGKSIVLGRAIEATRSPARRFARVSGLADGQAWIASLVERLGGRVATDAPRGQAWKALGEAARLCRWQGLHLVIVVDDCQALDQPGERLDLERLDHLDLDPSARLTILRIGRPDGLEPGPTSWDLAIRLEALTRSEAAGYLAAKLEKAGRVEPVFTPRAMTRLHAHSGGIPRGLDRLAGFALIAGADRGLEIISPEVVDSTASECLGDAIFTGMA